MAEIPIKRVNFFDGQFLKQEEFRELDGYHLHMRRRWAFVMFHQSGVVQATPTDLTLDTSIAGPPPNDKRVRVKAGMAIGKRPELAEAKEIVLPADVDVNLADAQWGVGAGSKAVFTVHYEENPNAIPASEGDVAGNTRIDENAIIKVFNGNLSAAPVIPEPYIVLGVVDFDSMSVDYTTRQTAYLNSGLVAPAAVSAPIITSLSGISSAAPGSAAVSAVVHGANLAGATLVTFSDPAVTAVVGVTTASTVAISVTVGAGASAGVKSFTVTTPGGTANSAGAASFTVTGAVALPSITGINLHSAAQGFTGLATITGTSLLGVTAVSFSPPGVTATPTGVATASSLPVNLTVAAAAVAGARTFTVTTPGGTASSAGVGGADFAVTPAALPIVLLGLGPNPQSAGGTVDISGTNIRNPALVPPALAVGTTVMLAKGAVSKAALNVIVRPDVAGHQVVRFTVPDRTGTPWGKTEVVTLTLSFNGSTASTPFTFDDP